LAESAIQPVVLRLHTLSGLIDVADEEHRAMIRDGLQERIRHATLDQISIVADYLDAAKVKAKPVFDTLGQGGCDHRNALLVKIRPDGRKPYPLRKAIDTAVTSLPPCGLIVTDCLSPCVRTSRRAVNPAKDCRHVADQAPTDTYGVKGVRTKQHAPIGRHDSQRECRRGPRSLLL
jgi:hypothetical protein